MEIHISDVRSFKSCRRKWNWSSPLRQNLEKMVTYAPFFTGKAVHYGLQQYYENGELPSDAAQRFMKAEFKRLEDEFGAFWQQEAETLQGQEDLVMGMLGHYTLWAKTESGVFADSNLRFLALETEFKVPIHNPAGRTSRRVKLAGRFDGVVQRLDDNSYWIFETKTTRSIKELQDSLQNDEQCGTYILAAQRMLGIKISGVLYNILRKKVPTVPATLQNGMLSQRADLDSTGEAFFAYAKQHHSEWTPDQVQEAYGGYIDNLLARGNTFFARVGVYRSDYELNQLETDLWQTALEMVRPSTPIYPNPSWINCRFCSFRQPCLAFNSGADVDFIFEHNYRVRKEWDPMTANEVDSGAENGTH